MPKIRFYWIWSIASRLPFIFEKVIWGSRVRVYCTSRSSPLNLDSRRLLWQPAHPCWDPLQGRLDPLYYNIPNQSVFTRFRLHFNLSNHRQNIATSTISIKLVFRRHGRSLMSLAIKLLEWLINIILGLKKVSKPWETHVSLYIRSWLFGVIHLHQ